MNFTIMLMTELQQQMTDKYNHNNNYRCSDSNTNSHDNVYGAVIVAVRCTRLLSMFRWRSYSKSPD